MAGIELRPILSSNAHLWSDMWEHYSYPNGFMGRTIAYLIYYENQRYGSIVGGSATLHLIGRNEFFVAAGVVGLDLNEIINNVFFHVFRVNDKYPIRNFVPAVICAFRQKVINDWIVKYGNYVIGFETLVKPPRTGDCYIRDGWEVVGQTKGMSAKRAAGNEGGKMGGKRVWNRTNLQPKLVLCRLA